jgi:cell division transport system permease protein
MEDLPGLLEENPFPASIEVRLRREQGTPGQIRAFAVSLRKLPGVEQVRFDADWVERVRSVMRVAWIGGAAIGILLLGAAVLTISAVIRMGVYERRDEIEILRLVGANPSFIRGPFLLEGALQGFAGSVAAVAGIAATTLLFSRSAGPLSVPLLADLLGSFIAPLDVAMLVAIGSLLGLAGSVMAGVEKAA